MNYLLFNNDIFISDGINVRRLDKGEDFEGLIGEIDKANICVVDVDVLIAAAPESPLERKDSILVRKFKELYQHESYVLQDERIDNNLFQIIGIKEQKVRDVYSLIGSEKIESFIPYGIAIRNTLITNKIDLNKTIVFVDDFASERLLTVFDGYKFSRTRIIINNGENLLPEIKRSQIDFFKKNEGFLSQKGADFLIVANRQSVFSEIMKCEEEIPVECLNVDYPALEGLKEINSAIKYILPEVVIKKRREIESRKKITTIVLSLCFLAIGFFYLIFNKIEWGLISGQRILLKKNNEMLLKKLSLLDRETYRQDLKLQKYLNFGVIYLTVLDFIPVNYEVNSFAFVKSGNWNLELVLFAENGGSFDPIPRLGILKNSAIKDIFVNNQPGKYLKIVL